MAETCFRDAEAVIDEVTVLEAALREAAASKRVASSREGTPAGSPQKSGFSQSALGVSEQFDAAVTSYGVQLRAWVNLQVDTRLSQVLQGLVEGEIVAARQESGAALDVAARLEGDLCGVADAQAKMLAVVQGISEELARLKAAVAACQLGAQLNTAVNSRPEVREETILNVEKIMNTVDSLKRTVLRDQEESESAAARLARHEAVLEDLRRRDERLDTSCQEVRGLLEDAQKQNREELADATGALVGAKQEVGDLVQLVRQLENKHSSWRTEVAALVASEVRAAAEQTRSRDVNLNRGLLETVQKQNTLESAMQKQFEESQSRFREELTVLQQQMIMELRAETTAAFKRESQAVAALDEQLWLTDQRLGQRIDELARPVRGADKRASSSERATPSRELRPSFVEAVDAIVAAETSADPSEIQARTRENSQRMSFKASERLSVASERLSVAKAESVKQSIAELTGEALTSPTTGRLRSIAGVSSNMTYHHHVPTGHPQAYSAAQQGISGAAAGGYPFPAPFGQLPAPGLEPGGTHGRLPARASQQFGLQPARPNPALGLGSSTQFALSAHHGPTASPPPALCVSPAASPGASSNTRDGVRLSLEGRRRSSMQPGPQGSMRAVTIGINYLGLRQGQLSGCINDSDTFMSLLTEGLGFAVEDVRQLRDDAPQNMPTRENITAALTWLVSGAKEGDHLFFHYSGHGSQQEDLEHDEMDGMDETLVPCDYEQAGMISDDELRKLLVMPLGAGVRLTCVLDCCHSGTLMDLPYKVSVSPDGRDSEMKKKAAHRMPAEVSEADIVMVSGCQDDQTSADVGAGRLGNTKSAGAMTSAFRSVLASSARASYKTLMVEMRRYLKTNGFTQVPQLSSEQFLNLDESFLPEPGSPSQSPLADARLCPRSGTKRAVTIGINYLTLQKGQGQLAGCVNDSDAMVLLLKDVMGFRDTDIRQLRDDRGGALPTKANMQAALRWLVEGTIPGDDLFLHFSGHGGQQKDLTGDEEDGQDEVLYPCDFETAGSITDDELYDTLVAPLPRGARMWVIFDCCHSGTALDLHYRVQLAADGKAAQFKELTRGGDGKLGMQANVIMLSGCQDAQTSADVQSGQLGNARAAGAMTTALKHCLTPTISCFDLIIRMRQYLRRNNFEQVPQLCSEQFLQLDTHFVNYSASRRRA